MNSFHYKKIGKLLGAQGAHYQGRVFFVANGYRHWLPDKNTLEAYGFVWPDDVTWVSDEELSLFKPARALPYPWNDDDLDILATPSQMRDFLANKLSGNGIEFGPSESPFPAPFSCNVQYADCASPEQLTSFGYYQTVQNRIQFSYITSIEDMIGIEDNSLDFIIACHVIEHVANPIRVIEKAFQKLKKNGQFLLVVPDKRLTFDRERSTTELAHLIKDYESPLKERDIAHFIEFYTFSFPVAKEILYQHAVQAFNRSHDIHYHTWTYESFMEMIEYIQKTISPWSDYSSYPAVNHPDANEFYFILRK